MQFQEIVMLAFGLAGAAWQVNTIACPSGHQSLRLLNKTFNIQWVRNPKRR
jgi:hypothetical protein